MNKTDLVNEIAAKAGLNKVAAKAALDACLESIAQALANDDKVQLIGFGTFAMVEKPERTGVNPSNTGRILYEPFDIFTNYLRYVHLIKWCCSLLFI